MSDEMASVCDAEVNSLLTRRGILEIHDNSPGFICSFFVLQKGKGSWRPIVNLKSLNLFIKYEHFKMENLDSVRFFNSGRGLVQ